MLVVFTGICHFLGILESMLYVFQGVLQQIPAYRQPFEMLNTSILARSSQGCAGVGVFMFQSVHVVQVYPMDLSFVLRKGEAMRRQRIWLVWSPGLSKSHVQFF